MLQFIKAYCIANYDNGWCDVAIETMEGHEIEAVIAGAKTEKGAIRKLKAHLAPYCEQRRAVQNEIF